MSEQELIDEMRKLREAIEKSNRQQAFHYTFGRGIVSALGATVGLTIVLAVSAYFLGQIIAPHIPAAQQYVQDVLQQLNQVKK